jgi:predicted DNA-binding transcriptional regulator YafY
MVKKVEKKSGHGHARPPLVRMLKIHQALQAGSFPNCRQLAEEQEVAGKTIQRDIDFMRDQLSLPIEYDAGRFGFYYTEPVTSFPTMQISEKELFSLYVAQKAVAEYRGTSLERPLADALGRLTEGLRDEITVNLQDWDASFSFRSAGTSATDVERFDQLSGAIRRRQEVRFSYRTLKNPKAERRQVHPYHLTCVDHLWYLLAYDCGRKALRTFALPRMGKVEVGKEHFQRPADFSPAQVLGGSFGVFSGSGKEYRIRLRFDSFAAQLIRERTWHESQQLREHRGGELTLELTLASLPEIQRWVLSWGSHVKVLGPALLKERVMESHREALKQY